MSIGAGPQLSNYPYGFNNGVSIRGVPLAQTHTGKAFWVYNGSNPAPGGSAGADGNPGTWQRPFATIAGALAQCLAGRGDVIFVKPGHAETISGAAGIALSVSNVSIVGIGAGNTRPSITFGTATTAQMTVTAAGVSLSNFLLDMTGFDAIVSGLSVTAADFSLLGCDVVLANATNQATTGLTTTAAADRLTIDSCRFRGTTDAGTVAALTIVGGDGHQISNNYFQGAYTSGTGAISNITTAMTNALIKNNNIANATAGSTKALTAVAGSTGMLSDNRYQILSGTAPVTAAGMSWVGANYYAASVGVISILV